MRRYAQMSDDQLVALYASGRNDAFDALLLRYDAYVHTAIRYWISDEELVEDLFQDVFIKVMMTIRQGRYTAEGKFRSWLGRITHNLIMDHFRRLRARGQEQAIEGASGEDLLLSIQLPSEDLTAEEAMIHGERLGELGEGLDSLSPVQREVIRLHYWEDKTFREIAEMTGVSINTALGRMRYALQHLRKAMVR